MTTVLEPNAKLVREELAKVVASPQFNKGEKLCRFLRFVVEEALAGRPENLKEYSIGIVVYERRPDYETRTDSTVRVEASRLRTKLIEYYAGPGASSPIRIELPKGSYVPRFVEAVLPVAPAHSRGWSFGAAAGVVAVAGLWWGYHQSHPGVSVLVAPFVALDGDKEAARVLTSELVQEIPKRTGWTAREISGATAGAILEHARRINATYLVSGSVRGGHAMVTFQTGDIGYKLWSRLFPVSGSTAIAEALRQPSASPPSPGTLNPEAAREYLEGHRILTTAKPAQSNPKQLPPHLSGSLKHFERATELDPKFAASWAAIAANLEKAAEWDVVNREEIKERTKQAAFRALSLDEASAEAHRVLGSIAFYREWNVKEAVYRFSRAVELEPRNPDMQRLYASALSLQERHAEAALEIGRAELSAPEVSPMSSGLAEVYFLARRYAEARLQARRAIALNQENAFAHWLLGVNAQLDGDFAEAELEYKWCLRKYALDSRAISGLAHLRAKQGRSAEARALLDDAIRQWGTPHGWHCSVAMTEWEIGDTVKARQALRQCAELREGSALYMLVDPRFDPMRKTPEFQEMDKRVTR